MSLPPLVHRRDAGDCRLFSSTQNYLNTKRVSAARHPWPYLITFLQKATTKKPTTIRQFSSAMDTFPIQRSSERQFLMVTHLASKPPLATAIALVFLVNIGKVVSNSQFPIVIFKLRMRKWRPMRISVDLAWGRRRGGRVLGPDLQLQHLTGLREKLDTASYGEHVFGSVPCISTLLQVRSSHLLVSASIPTTDTGFRVHCRFLLEYPLQGQVGRDHCAKAELFIEGLEPPRKPRSDLEIAPFLVHYKMW